MQLCKRFFSNKHRNITIIFVLWAKVNIFKRSLYIAFLLYAKEKVIIFYTIQSEYLITNTQMNLYQKLMLKFYWCKLYYVNFLCMLCMRCETCNLYISSGILLQYFCFILRCFMQKQSLSLVSMHIIHFKYRYEV